MTDLDNYIKNKLDEYSLENYSIHKGWEKLRKKANTKRMARIRLIAGIAASCLIAITGYWLLVQNIKRDKKQALTSVIIKPEETRQEQQPDAVGKDTVTIINYKHVEPVKSAAVRIHKNEPKRLNDVASVCEKVFSEAGNETILINDGVKKDSVRTVLVEKKEAKGKPLEILTEEQFVAMVSAGEDPKPKRGKLTTLFINKAEQQEYDVPKYSSEPINTQKINF